MRWVIMLRIGMLINILFIILGVSFVTLRDFLALTHPLINELKPECFVDYFEFHFST